MGTPDNPSSEMVAPPTGASARKSAEERKELLAKQIQNAAATGARVETQSDFQAIVVRGKPVNHVLHGVLTLFTLGVWGIVWIILALTGGENGQMLLVDEWGNPSIQQPAERVCADAAPVRHRDRSRTRRCARPLPIYWCLNRGLVRSRCFPFARFSHSQRAATMTIQKVVGEWGGFRRA
jgi:hypothetical protein